MTTEEIPPPLHFKFSDTVVDSMNLIAFIQQTFATRKYNALIDKAYLLWLHNQDPHRDSLVVLFGANTFYSLEWIIDI